jgi:hypothetical protein
VFLLRCVAPPICKLTARKRQACTSTHRTLMILKGSPLQSKVANCHLGRGGAFADGFPLAIREGNLRTVLAAHQSGARGIY